jgi:hypothetical protein
MSETAITYVRRSNGGDGPRRSITPELTQALRTRAPR